jgi:hypothetical protein
MAMLMGIFRGSNLTFVRAALPRAMELKGVDAVRQRGWSIMWRNVFDNKEGRPPRTSDIVVTRSQSAASAPGVREPMTCA